MERPAKPRIVRIEPGHVDGRRFRVLDESVVSTVSAGELPTEAYRERLQTLGEHA